MWDGPNLIRKQEFSDYKAKRQAAPDELLVQKEHIIEALDKMGIKQLCIEGFEADDLLGELAGRFSSDNKVVVISPDKDLLQLVEKKISVFDPMKHRFFQEKEVIERFGFGPEKVKFYFSLLGDASDGIPGVKGVGEKTAYGIVEKFDFLYLPIDKNVKFHHILE